MRLLILSVFFVCLQSCLNVTEHSPDAEGKSGEITVFIPKEYRNQGLEEAVDSALYGLLPGLYPKEPIFDVEFEEEKELEDMIDLNIIEFNIDEKNDPQVLVKQGGMQATDQFHMVLYARSLPEAINLVLERKENIITTLNQTEYNRVSNKIRKNRNKAFANKILEQQQVTLTVPEYLNNFMYNSEEFSSVSGYETAWSQGFKLLIQQYLFVMNFPDNGDSLNFTPAGLIWQCNGYLKKWAKMKTNSGKIAFMQITNDSSAVPVFTKEVVYRDAEAMELRGNMASQDEEGNGYGFGGYFVALAIRDVENERVVVSIGMANVPRDFWYREYIRQQQAVVYTTEF